MLLPRVGYAPGWPICLTSRMAIWDSGAAAHLEAVVHELREVGAVSLLEEQVRAVWRRNVDGHDPLLGDTSLSLGIDCSENLRELLVRECTGGDSPWQARGLSASVRDRSLRLDVSGVRIFLMKAPPRPSARTPQWDGAAFHWEQQSEVRLDVAERNCAAYDPVASDQTDRQLAMALDGEAPDATRMRDFMVVWSGQIEPVLTAGWIGLPSLERPGWFAVEPLWWDEPGEDGVRREDVAPPSSGDGFDALPTPQPNISLKPRQTAAGVQR